MQISLYNRVPFLLKLKCILLMYVLMMVLDLCFISVSKFPKPEVNDSSTMTTSEAIFKSISGETIVVNKETSEQLEDIQNTSLISMWAILIFIVICTPYIYYCRCTFIRRKIDAISEICLVDKNIYLEIVQMKRDFIVDNRADISIVEKIELLHLLTLGYNSVMLGLFHGNLLMDDQILKNVPYTNLQRFMFSDLDWIYGLGYIVLTRYMKDLLRAVQYLHKHNIYHLDIQPSNILIMSSWNNEKGSCAKLGGFKFARKIETGKVACNKVGLTDIYSAPECFKADEVDAAKFDCWGIGITAFDAFTGGMFTVLTTLEEFSNTKFFELVECKKLLDQSYFVSALDASWDVFETMYRMQISLNEFTNMYDLDAFEFSPDCWKFVKELLKFDPLERSSVDEALEAPLIQKLYEGNDDKRKINKLKIFQL